MRVGLLSWYVTHGVGCEGQTMTCWSKSTLAVDAPVRVVAGLVGVVAVEVMVSWTLVLMFPRRRDVGRSLGPLERVASKRHST